MTAYFNEFDPKAAAWLRELIRRGLIADGVVDERSILDVQPDDLRGFTQCHFFAGIGGWSLALRMAGWPDDRPVWTGSPPCQPFSAAGRQKGKDDERHLAPHFASLVAACQPVALFGEQVASAAVFGKATSRSGKATDGNAAPEWAWLDDLFERLEAAHYACGASDIPAAGVGAAHIRQRTFFGACRLADLASARLEGAAGAFLQERGDRHASSSSNDGLADAECDVSGRRSGETLGTQAQSGCVEKSSDYGFVHDGWNVRLADADDARSQGRRGVPECIDQRAAGSGGLEDGLEHPQSNGRQQRRPEPSGRGAASGRGGGGLADANGGNTCAEREQRGGKHRQQQEDGGIGGLADADAGQQGVVGRGDQPLRGGAPRDARAGHRSGGEAGRPHETDLGWPSADWLFCRDGKWRPVGPGTFPLAHGVSARVGRLRGYGNAIVPQAAVEFVKAFDAAAAECFRLNDLSGMTTDNEGVFG